MGFLKFFFFYFEFALVQELECGQTSLLSLGNNFLACANLVVL